MLCLSDLLPVTRQTVIYGNVDVGIFTKSDFRVLGKGMFMICKGSHDTFLNCVCVKQTALTVSESNQSKGPFTKITHKAEI